MQTNMFLEPVGKRQDVGANHHNILEAFYKELKQYEYTFQNYIFVTSLMQERESVHSFTTLRLMERKIFSARMIIFKTLFDAFRST